MHLKRPRITVASVVADVIPMITASLPLIRFLQDKNGCSMGWARRAAATMSEFSRTLSSMRE